MNENTTSKLICDESFEYINNVLLNENNLRCDMSECIIYQRHNRDREGNNRDQDDSRLSIEMDIIDSIHCHFVHSMDNEYRFIKHVDEEMKRSDDDMEYLDEEIKAIKSELSSRCSRIPELTRMSSCNHSKFVTQICIEGTY